MHSTIFFFFFFFNDTATTEIYTLSLHDALPIFERLRLRDERLRHPDVVRQLDHLEVMVLPAHLLRQPYQRLQREMTARLGQHPIALPSRRPVHAQLALRDRRFERLESRAHALHELVAR